MPEREPSETTTELRGLDLAKLRNAATERSPEAPAPISSAELLALVNLADMLTQERYEWEHLVQKQASALHRGRAKRAEAKVRAARNVLIRHRSRGVVPCSELEAALGGKQ